MPLTDVQVRNAKASAAPYKLTDGNGMFLLVQPNGAKYWRLSYRFLGKQKTLALGVYGRPLECGQLNVCLSRLLHRATLAVQPRATWRKPDRLHVVRYVHFIHVAVFHDKRLFSQNCEVSWNPTVTRAVGKPDGL